MQHFEEACCEYFESCTPRFKTVTTLPCEFQKSYLSSTTMSEMSKAAAEVVSRAQLSLVVMVMVMQN